MPSRLVHAWRADSIWPRLASTSGVGAQAAETKVLSTARMSVDDSFARSGGSTCAPLHHAGGAASAALAHSNDDTPHTVTMAIVFISLSRVIIRSKQLIRSRDVQLSIDVQREQLAVQQLPQPRADPAHRGGLAAGLKLGQREDLDLAGVALLARQPGRLADGGADERRRVAGGSHAGILGFLRWLRCGVCDG